MKQFTTIFLLFLILFQLCHKVEILVSFFINQKEIAAKECENRDKPKLHCNGNCVLMKKLKAAEEHELQAQKEQSSKKQQKDKQTKLEILDCLEIQAFLIENNVVSLLSKKKQTLFYQISFSTHHIKSPFQPPEKLAAFS